MIGIYGFYFFWALSFLLATFKYLNAVRCRLNSTWAWKVKEHLEGKGHLISENKVLMYQWESAKSARNSSGSLEEVSKSSWSLGNGTALKRQVSWLPL